MATNVGLGLSSCGLRVYWSGYRIPTKLCLPFPANGHSGFRDIHRNWTTPSLSPYMGASHLPIQQNGSQRTLELQSNEVTTDPPLLQQVDSVFIILRPTTGLSYKISSFSWYFMIISMIDEKFTWRVKVELRAVSITQNSISRPCSL